MKEQLVTFDTAKLAKDRGFNIKTLNAWAIVNKETRCRIINASELFDNEYYAPTQSLLQKWLREVHHIIIYPRFVIGGIGVKDGYILEMFNPPKNGWSLKNDKHIHKVITTIESSYEEALEKGLQEALKLIK